MSRVVAITGAGGALGAALAAHFAAEPDTDLVLSDVSDASLGATVDALPEARGPVETLLADVSDVAQADAVGPLQLRGLTQLVPAFKLRGLKEK